MSTYQIPTDILERLRVRDPTLTNDLSLGDLAKIYKELEFSGPRTYKMYYSNMQFIRKFLIPKKTVKKLITKREWEFLMGSSYINYITELLSYLGNEDDKEGIEAVRNLILKEGVDMDRFDAFNLHTQNSRVLKLLIDLNPQIIRQISNLEKIRDNTPLLTDIFSYAKDKMSKEFVLKFLDELHLRFRIEMEKRNKLIIVILMLNIVDFVDIYSIILRWNRPENIEWANRIIEAQI